MTRSNLFYDDGSGLRCLSEDERLKLMANEEHANDPAPTLVYIARATPSGLPALSQVEEVEARSVVERARWQARQNASLVCCDYED